MCYLTVLSTNSNQDLSEYNSDLVSFCSEYNKLKENNFLEYKNKWFIARKGESCSCGFRYVERWNIEALGFSEPEDWSPEDPEDIKATHEIVNVILQLLESGEKVDSVTSWQDEANPMQELLGNIKINISEIGIERFRFFDDYRFDYEK